MCGIDYSFFWNKISYLTIWKLLLIKIQVFNESNIRSKSEALKIHDKLYRPIKN